MQLIAAANTQRASRRRLLKMGGLGLAGLSLPRLLLAEAAGERPRNAKARNCIFIFLCGGPSQNDLWDLKPDAPEGIRSVFSPIETNVPGIRFGELLPQVARHADKLALVRSMTHGDNNHDGGIVHTLLGQLPARPGDFYVSRQDHPGLGAILHRELGGCGEMPPWVVLPRPFTTYSPPYKGQSAGFLGAAFDPIVLDKETKASLSDLPVRLDSLSLPEGVDQDRLAGRRNLLVRTNQSEPAASPAQGPRLEDCYEKAFAMLGSGATRQAFDLEQEPAAARDRYGRNEYGQSFLMARRLVEAGVRVVNAFWTFFDDKGCQFNLWDNHGVATDVCGVGGARTGLDMLKHDYCCPSFDRAFSALLEDLGQRGLLDETLVAVAGEFGRTPQINATAGRDHWAPCYTQLLAGGGVCGGQVYGASDKVGAFVKDLPVSPDDFAATILHAFGVSGETFVPDQLARPHAVTAGRPVLGLF
ncbi:MAG: DUF1501 domain-containing protein [Pirellulales bacterium]